MISTVFTLFRLFSVGTIFKPAASSRLMVVLCASLMLLSGHAFSKTVPISEGMNSPALGKSMVYWIDESGSATIDDILKNGQKTWEGVELDTPNFGFNSQVYWFRLNTRSVENKSLKVLLSVEYSALDNLQIYEIHENLPPKLYQLGDTFPFKRI